MQGTNIHKSNGRQVDLADSGLDRTRAMTVEFEFKPNSTHRSPGDSFRARISTKIHYST